MFDLLHIAYRTYTINEIKNKYHLVGTVGKYNRQIVETDKKTKKPPTHITVKILGLVRTLQ